MSGLASCVTELIPDVVVIVVGREKKKSVSRWLSFTPETRNVRNIEDDYDLAPIMIKFYLRVLNTRREHATRYSSRF